MNTGKLIKYTREHALRVSPDETPEENTIDMIFFQVGADVSSDKTTFLELVKEECPHWLDGEEHNYLQTGGDMGDQGIALLTMALGGLLGVWQVLTPANMFGDTVPKELLEQMTGMGMISILYKARK